MNTINQRYRNLLNAIPPEGSGVHRWLLGVANLGAINRLSAQEVINDIRNAVSASRQRARPDEIPQAVKKAFSEYDPSETFSNRKHFSHTKFQPVPKTRPPIDGRKYFKELVRESPGITTDDIKQLSPIPVNSINPATFLLKFYSPDEWLFIGDVYSKKVNRVADLINTPESFSEAPHIIPNPFTGSLHETKSGKLSARCDAAIKSFRFAVVEFDDMPKENQCSFWTTVIKQELLPVTCLIDSGGKSIHAWIRVDLPDRQSWDREIAEKLYDKHTGILTLLGADPACKNPSRLSRMPGHTRKGTGNIQQLLYLNPDIR